MHTILIANPKGGCGKTTLATNVAGFLAGSRRRVAIADDDPQQSATFWLGRRPELFPKIALAPADARERKEFDWIVVDSPAGIHGDQLRDEMRRADAVLIPLTPSVFDMAATARFLHTIAEYKSVKGGELPIGLVAMRFDARTHSATELDEFLAACKLPIVGHLRDTQVYVWCARDGASVFDLPRSRGEQDWEQWKPLAHWIAKIAG